jgi:hypothetical protein
MGGQVGSCYGWEEKAPAGEAGPRVPSVLRSAPRREFGFLILQLPVLGWEVSSRGKSEDGRRDQCGVIVQGLSG